MKRQGVSASLSAHYFSAAVQDARFADAVFDCVQRDRRLPYIRKDAKGRLAFNLAHGRCRERMFEALFFLGRYELLNADAPKHRSATCVVLFARDHGEQLFPAGGGGAEEQQQQEGGGGDTGSSSGGSGGDCVLKFMRNREQWERELSARGGALEPESYARAIAASGGVVLLPELHEHSLAPAADAPKHPQMGEIDAVGHHAEGCDECGVRPLGKGGYRCTEGCYSDFCSGCVAQGRWALAGGLRRQQLAAQRFSPQHVIPVLRQHEAGKGEAVKAHGDGLRDFPFVLVLPKGEEDLEGAHFWPCGRGLRQNPLRRFSTAITQRCPIGCVAVLRVTRVMSAGAQCGMYLRPPVSRLQGLSRTRA